MSIIHKTDITKNAALAERCAARRTVVAPIPENLGLCV